ILIEQVTGSTTSVKISVNRDGVTGIGTNDLIVVLNSAQTLAPSNFVLSGSTLNTNPTAIAGIVADGYIAGAEVFLDLDNDRIKDAGEPSAQTDSNGKFSITFSGDAGQLAASTFVATGGTDISTGKPNVLTLLAPSDTAQGPGDGKVVVNPLTTLIQTIVSQDNSSSTLAAKLTSAQSNLQLAFGIHNSLNLLEADPIALATSSDLTLAARGLQAQKVAVQLAQMLQAVERNAAAGSESSAVQAALTSLAAKVAGSTTALNLGNATTVADLLGTGVAPSTAAKAAQLNAATASATTLAALTSTQGAPVLVTTLATGASLSLSFDEPLGATLPAPSLFTVTQGSSNTPVAVAGVSRSASPNDNQLVLTLASPITANTTNVKLSYTAPAANSSPANAAIQDVAGNDVAAFA
ncbi:MAG: hypothetical protein EB072_20460, partial [Betaproteobacteria bacterium]|nr:hypothetical protein [Betaproteobacteria bacterium]